MEDKLGALFAAVEHLAEKAGETNTLKWLRTIHGPALSAEIDKQKRDHLEGWKNRISPVIAQAAAGDAPSQIVLDIRAERSRLLEEKERLELEKLRKEVATLKAGAAQVPDATKTAAQTREGS